MLGAIIGDTIGSVYEFCNIKDTKFPLFSEHSGPTDDSVMSIAVAEWLLSDPERTQQKLEDSMVKGGHKYPRAGYGGAFANWLFSPQFLYGYRDDTNTDEDSKYGTRHPYNSWGNGSAMRASACGWVSRSIEEALDLGKRSAEITHNHPEDVTRTIVELLKKSIYIHKNETNFQIYSPVRNSSGWHAFRVPAL